MNCPFCNKELEVVGLHDKINWINWNDTVAEMLCWAYCRGCGREYSFKKVYVKTEEKDLVEM